jgi:hypothetical protein
MCTDTCRGSSNITAFLKLYASFDKIKMHFSKDILIMDSILYLLLLVKQ